MTFSADDLVASIFCLIVIPLKGYDEPEVLPSQSAQFCLIGADPGHVGPQIRLLVLDATPQPFDKHIIRPSFLAAF